MVGTIHQRTRRSDAMDVVEQGLEKLDMATTKEINDGSEKATLPHEDATEQERLQQNMEDSVHITDIDPLSIDLPYVIRQLLDTVRQEKIAVPAAGESTLKYLEGWSQTPEKTTVGGVLDRLSALLLAESIDSLEVANADAAANWSDGKLTLATATAFRPILVDLVGRWTLSEAPGAVFRHTIASASSQHRRKEDAQVRVAYAAGILMSTAPQIRSLVIDYFEKSNGPSIAQLAADAESTDKQEAILVIAHRLLRRLPEIVDGVEAWDWTTPLVRLMGAQATPLARLLACECMCVVQSLSDNGRATLVQSLALENSLVARTLAWLGNGEREFDDAAAMMMVSVNQQGVEQKAWQAQTADDVHSHPWITEGDLAKCVASVGGVLLHAHASARSSASRLVLTPTVVRNIREMALATSRSEPVLLQGASGSGKTSLVEWVAQRTGNELVTIHLSSNMDAKVLLGNYVTTQRAGDFEWRAGLLTTAVADGQWVLIENIDLAPPDVIQTLVPLLESHTLFVATRGEAVRAHIRFRLFATLSAAAPTAGRGGSDGLLGSSMWTRLQIASLETEVPQIVAGAFPRLAAHADSIAASFAKVAAAVAAGGGAQALSLSTGDLIKWCTRLSRHESSGDAFALFQEAIDTFTMREPDYDKWRRLVQRVGAAFGIAKHRADQHIDQHSPAVATTGSTLAVGRASLPVDDAPAPVERMPFATTRHAGCLLERIATCVQLAEPALLLGETGTGKTTVVQHLAALTRRPLAVFNLSQQSDSSDLLGGFRPVDIAVVALRLRESFDALFGRTVSVSKNAAFLDRVRAAFGRRDWRRLAGLFKAAVGMSQQVIDKAHAAVNGDEDANEQRRKKQRLSAETIAELEAEWQAFAERVDDFEALKGARMVFSFVEGALVKAARNGGWILLDEINLATAETLACLGGLLQKERSLLLAETGVRIRCHPDFRLFACMNPSNDVGKRDLPPGLRSSFTEFFVHPPDAHADDLLAIVRSHLPPNTPPAVAHRVIGFYRSAKRLAADHRLADGAGQKPHYSLRTLTRSLTYARDHALAYSLKRALYDGLCMTFVTQLDGATQSLLATELHAVFEGDDLRQMLTRVPPSRAAPGEAVMVQGFWLPAVADAVEAAGDGYVVTRSVEAKLRSLARAAMCGRFPVLIQGPTSAGKTSMVQHLARATGHHFVRINNHEHTDLQEYLGAYTSADGRLVFEEGLLVKALRSGHWLVLDELNLAPSDVLEALNRLLDDNRELVIPETQEIVRPHPHFMLFATQNPAGLYGGRKALSRAFRNRFVELHFDDIPEAELQQIITDSCRVPPTHASLLVAAYRNLTQVRAQNRIFEASHGFVTLRDLFRWANRHAATKDELAEHGFMLLAERVRSDDEQLVVRRAIERAFYSKTSSSAANANVKRAISVDGLYSEDRLRAMPEFQAFESRSQRDAPPIAWTKAMRRLFILTALCVRFHEPVLLVGETGCGKTTVCQMLAAARDQRLHIVNCHQNTESSDILGGQRPVRNRAALVSAAHAILSDVCGPDQALLLLPAEGSVDSPDALHTLVAQWRASADPALQAAVEASAAQLEAAQDLLARSQGLFAWHDGPLVQAMKQGDMFLMDELNLADDSVLERLNSVLEPSRTLVLAENVGAASLTAAEGFEFVATMNPGGDYGKRELSPALRNRFTELWAPTTQDRDDLQLVLLKRLEAVPEAEACARVILDFVACLRDDLKTLQHPLSLRDYLFWADFVAKTHGLLGARASVVHGACLVLLDGVGAQGSIFGASTVRLPSAVKAECVSRLRIMVGWSETEHGVHDMGVVPARTLMSFNDGGLAERIEHKEAAATVGVAPFFVECGPQGGRSDGGAFTLDAPTTFDNLVKILRAMQVGKPLLLEGSPGVGKTTLVSTLARLAGHRLVRINLSDQTDLMDLFGTDLPVDGGFAWCDAPFLQALKRGDWVLLDEINLASQSVLEGLNSCLDHRGTVYIAELDREFALAPGFRLFAAQNPLGQGGGRKGLPRSFVNRFTQVYMDELTRDDLLTICNTVYAGFAAASTTGLVLEFNWRMHDATMTRRLFGAAGAPWEFNLRDVSRFMELALQPSTLERGAKPVDEFVAMLYIQRMRSPHDRAHVAALFRTVFGRDLDLRTPLLHVADSHVQIGNAVLPRLSGGGSGAMSHVARLASLHGQLAYLESLAKCIEMRWMAILVGPAGSGKTSMVRWLASATGNRLVEFSMNSGVDTSEIIGGFEQVDVQRHRTSLLTHIDTLLRQALLAASDSSLSAQPQRNATMVRACGLFHAAKRCVGTRNLCAAVEQILDAVGGLAEVNDLVGAARRELGQLAALEAAGRFEWVDGILVDALVNGHWLLVDRANLCSSSVLDRLNGLLEPNGVLYVTEDPKRTHAVVPHPNFRIVMAVDPQHGELSRAMRNRGIEICVLPPSGGTDETQDARRVRAIDQAAVAQAVGLSNCLIPADMARESSLTAVVHHAVRLTERTQRGFAARLDGPSARELLASRYAPTASGSSASVACWQAHMAHRAMAATSALERMALFLAVIGTLPPAAGALAAAMFRSIFHTDGKNEPIVDALLAAPLAEAMAHARALVAADCHINGDVLASAPSYVALNASLYRALLRHSDNPAVRWHQALCAALLFQRERIASTAIGDMARISDSASALQAALQRPDTDVAYVQSALELADMCDALVNAWDAAIASRNSVAKALSDGGDLAACVPVLRSIHRLAHRIRRLVGAEDDGSNSALAVAFEETQGALQQMACVQMLGDHVQQALAAVRPLVLDAAHSAKVWALVHPTTLCDQSEREIEARLQNQLLLLLESTDELATAELREAVVEALAMLYATTGRKDRRLIVGAVSRFANSLPALECAKQANSAPTPAKVLADVRVLADWQHVAQLAVLASSGNARASPGGASGLQELSVAQLRVVIDRRMSVGNESSWAPVFARLSWALNEHRSAKRPQPLDALPLVSDIVDQWHEQMDNRALLGILDTPTLRLTRPVATELTWRSAATLAACTLADHTRVHDEAVGMLRALATHTPPENVPERDLAALVWLVAQTVGAVCGGAEECGVFQNLSAAVAMSLLNGGSADLIPAANTWRKAVDRATAVDRRVTECISPAADAVHAALVGDGSDTQCQVLAATVAVHIAMMTLSFPRRKVDPAARAHTRWEWLGEDITAAHADHAAYTAVQQSMTGDSHTVATQPFALAVSSLESQQAAIERVYRPVQAPPFAELWQEANILCSSVFARVHDVCAQLLNRTIGNSSSSLTAAAHALVTTLAQFQARIRGRYYDAFRDVAQIWCTHARAIAHALARLADERSRADAKTAVRREHAELIARIYAMPAADVPATDVSNASTVHTLARLKAMIFFAQKKKKAKGDAQEDEEQTAVGGARSALRAYGELLKALLLRATLGVQARGRVAPADVAALDAVFRDAHDIHRRAAEAKRKRDAEAASLFKSRAPVEQTDDDLVRELFPGYEDLFDEEAEDSNKPAETDTSKDKEPSDDDLDEDTVAAIAACHQYVMLQFGAATDCAPDLRAPLVRDAQQAALRLAASAYGARHDVAALQPDGADGVLRAANMAALAAIATASDASSDSASSSADEPSGIRASTVRNFYRDAWPSEAVRVRPVAQAISDRAIFLLEEWPEHAGLQLIRDSAQRLVSESVTAPVARLLAGVEQLHTRALDSWETYASRDVSMREELAAATSLIVRWRQAELNAWPHVLRTQELACASRAASEWWFSLYAVLAAPEEPSSVAELAAALDHFAHGCPAGEFRARLNLLLAFAAHRAALLAARASCCDNMPLADALRSDAIYGPLVNAIGYYLQYAPCVGDHLARAKKPIQKDLAQYVKISSWKDVNPAALRASALRTHRHLAKCVRKWREALAQPVFQIIQAHQASTIASAHVPAVSLVATPLADAGFDIVPRLPSLDAATLGDGVACPWIPSDAALPLLLLGDGVAANVAALAHPVDPELAKVLDASPATLQRLRRLMENSRVFGKHNATGSSAEDVFGEFAEQAAGDIRYFQGMETPNKLLKKPAAKSDAKDGAPGKKKKGKHIIGGNKEDATGSKEGEEDEIDDEERQRLVDKFWGEQRNLRRTRLKEILRGLQDLGLKRYFHAATGTPDDSAQAAATGGLAGLLQLRPMDIQSWRSATSIASSADPRLVLSCSAQTLRSLQTADAAFFRLSSQIAQLRTTAFDTDRNPETSGAQVRAISGLLECLNHHVIQDRSCAADLVADAATLMRVASAWPSATDDSANVIETLADSGGSASLDELKLAADTVAALLLQLRTNVRAISETGGWGVHASAVDRAMAPINEAAAQFDGAHSTLASASSLVVSFGTAGIDGRTADACASAYAHIRKARHAVSLAARAIIDALSGSDLDPRVLGPWVGPTTEAADLVVSLCSAATEPTAVAEQVGDMSGFAALAGRWVTGVMGVWQAIHAAETQYPANAAERERNVWGFTPKELVRKLAVLQATAKALRLPLMIPVLRDLTLQRRTQSTVQKTGGEIDRCVQPWVLQYSLMVQHVVSMYADVHQSVVHFALGMAVSLTSVIAHGMGPQGDSIAEPEDSGNTSTQTGTGMGEGSTAGAKNVSDEIEGEDQVEGLRDDAAADEENEPDTNEDAVDMQNDFEGKMGDADLETDDSDSDKSDDSDDEDQEMDEQMGDVDPTDPTALDEKLWDDEKDGDDENKDSAKDADETVDSKAKQSKPDTDIVAGQEEAEDDDKQQDKDGDTKEPAGQGEDEGSDDEMQSDGDDEGSGDDELDDRINKDTLDRMADVDDLGEQLEMPDDLDMDNQDNEEEDDGIEADMAGDDLPEDEPIDQKPDAAMDEDSAEKANDNEDADNAVEGEDGEKADDDNGMVDDELDGDVSDMGGEDADGSDQDDEADQSGDEPGEEEEDDEEEKGRENALIDEDSQLNKKEEEATGADNPTGGLDSAMNLDGNDEANPDAAAESQDAVDKPSNSNEQQQHQKSQPDANGIAQQQQQQQSPDQTREQGEEEEDSNKRSMDSERTLADVIEKWERRLNIIMREDEPAPTNEAEPEPSSDDKDEAAKKQNDNSSSGDQQPAPESSEFEHVKEDEDFDKVALADANDEELEKQQHQPMDIDEDDNDGQQQQQQQQQQQLDEEESDAQNQDDKEMGDESTATSKAPANPLQQADPKTQPRQPPSADKEARNTADAAQLQQSVAPEEDGQDSDGDEHMSEDEGEGQEEQRQQEKVDIDQLREELEAKTAEWRVNSQDSENAVQLWQAYTRLTHDLSLMLTEQLRLILTPTQATQLKGDYRTGKRLNMKRIIPYIASEFRKDKIWLRRTKPARREYQVMVALDNSKSMVQSSHAVELAYETLALITTALTQLEIGQLSVVSFGEQVNLLHPFDSVFDSDAGARVLSRFTFADDKTDVVQLMDASLQLFEAAEQSFSSSSSSELWRLQLVVSDGVCQDHARLLQQVRAAMEQRVMVVFIVLDRSAIATTAGGEAVDPEKDSIMNTQHVSFVKGVNGKMEMRVERYLDTFPFKYYVVLRDVNGLPAVLAETLRQYFSLVGNS